MSHQGLRTAAFGAVAVLLAAGVGALSVLSPSAAAAVVLAPFLLLAVLASSAVRLTVVVAGALIVFQAPSDSIKYEYLALTITCVLVSLVQLFRHDDEVRRAFRPMLAWSVVVLAMLAASYVNARATGADPSNWFRDMLPYLLVVVLPIVGLEAAQRATPRAMAVLFGVLGVVSALAFATDWLNRRAAVEGLGRVILATATLPLLMFAYALVRAGLGPHRVRWTVVSAVIPAALVITGTRTYLVVLVPLILGLVGRRSKARLPALRVLTVVAVGGGAAAALVVVLARDWISTAFVSGRVSATVAAFTGHATTDQSFVLRADSYRAAHSWWLQHPWTGGGPGHLYSNGTFSLDTPLQVPAKFGVIGTVVLVGYLLSIAASIGRSRLAWDPFHTAGRGWSLALVTLIPFGSWLEDKGTALSLALIVCATATVAYSHRRQLDGHPSGPGRGSAHSPVPSPARVIDRRHLAPL